MKQLTVRMSREAAQDLSKQARAAGIPPAALARSLILKGMESSPGSITQQEMCRLLLAVLRAASAAAAIAEMLAERGLSADQLAVLRADGKKRIAERFEGYMTTYEIENGGEK